MQSQTLTTEELTLVYILQSIELTRKALRLRLKNKVKLFDDDLTPHVSILWDAYVCALRDLGESWVGSSKELRLAKTRETLAKAKPLSLINERCLFLLDKATTENIDDSQVIEGLELLRRAIGFDANRKFMSTINANPDLKKLQEQLDKSKQAIEVLSDDKPKARTCIRTPLSEVADLMCHRERIPMGINFLDKLSNGGGRAKELWTILGPSGGGKTMLTVQLAVAQTLMGNHCVWVTYEQSMEGDLTERMVANVLGGGLSGLRDKAFSDLPEEDQARYWGRVAGLADNLTVIDMTMAETETDDPKYNRGMYAVWQKVKEVKASGKNVKIVLIDWFGELLTMLCGDLNLDGEREYRSRGMEQIAIAREMAKTEDLMIIFWHQLNTQTQTAKPTHKPTKGDAFNMKSLSYNMDAMFALGTRDKHDVAYFLALKARKGDLLETTVQMEGEKARFTEVHGWVPNRDGEFYKPGEDMNAETYEAVDQREDAAASYKREV